MPQSWALLLHSFLCTFIPLVCLSRSMVLSIFIYTPMFPKVYRPPRALFSSMLTCPTTYLLNICSWMSNRHLKLNMFQTEFLIFLPFPKPVPPKVPPTSVDETPSSCSDQKPWIPFFLSHPIFQTGNSLVLPSEYTQNLAIAYHLHCHHPCLNHGLLLGLLK